MANYQWNPLTDEKKFEDLINDLCSKKYGIEFQIYGRKGQKQYGIDGSALTADKKHILHQCKNKMISRSDSAIQSELLKDLETETVSMLSEFIEKKDYILDKFIFVNSFKRDTKLQDKATELSVTHDIVVIVWSWDEISDMLEEYTDIAQKYYPQSFNKTSNTKLSPQLTTKLGKSTLIGREKELQEIDEQLKASTTLLVKGIGGVGKSTIASNYLHRHKDEYDYYGFFEGLENFESELEGAFKLEIEQGQDRLDRVLRELIKLDGNKLLVIDDVKDIKENQEKLEKILGLEHNGYRVLLSSRFKVKNVKIYPLLSLDPSDAQKLFLKNCKTEELEKVNQITKYLDYHPLFVELVAKTIENEGYSLDDMIEKFELGELAKIEFIDEEEGDEVSFNQNLQKLFEMQKESLKDEYLLLLKQLSVLPSIDIELSFLEKIFNRKLQGRLNFLVAQGWLIESIDGYKLHQVVKEFLLANYTPNFEEIDIIVKFFYELLPLDNITIDVSKKKYIVFFESIVSILKLIKEIEVEIISVFSNSIGILYHYFGDYKLALFFYERSLRISEKLSNNRGIATSLNNIAEIYQLLGVRNKALEFYEKSIKLTELEFGLETPEIAIKYNNIARLYDSWKKYDKSLVFYNKSLQIREKILGINNYFTAQSYNNIGVHYEEQEKFEQALSFHTKALKIRENLFGEKHIETAQSYHNLGSIYLFLNEYKKVLFYLNKSLQIKEELLGFYHYETANTYVSLAGFYFYTQNYKKAIVFIEKTLKIRERVFSATHKDLILAKDMYIMIQVELIRNLKTGRNDPCPCKSGKKYKKCCGKNS